MCLVQKIYQRCRLRNTLLFFIFSFFLISIPVKAEQKVTLEADRVTSQDNNTVTAAGNVLILYKDMTLTADKVRFDRKKNIARAWDNVTFRDKDNIIHASFIKIDLDTRKGLIRDGKGFYKPYHYFTAQKIEKIGENNYILHNSTISSCSGEVPDWSFRSDKARINYGEYFTADDATANIKNIPVLYFPYFIWPIKTDRESGFLIPNAGYSNEVGAFFTPKYFWNISVDKDATFGLNYYSFRGLQYLAEFRYNKSRKEDIYLYGEYFYDRDSEANKNKRWKIVNKSNVYLTDDIELRFNTDYVSDFRYKRDFDKYSMVASENENSDDESENYYINEMRLNIYKPLGNLYIKYRDEMEYFDRQEGFSKSHLIKQPEVTLEKNFMDAKLFYIDYHFDYNRIKKTDMIYQNEEETSFKETTIKRNNGYLNLYKPFNLKILTFTPHYRQYYTRWYDYSEQFNVSQTDDGSLLKLDQEGNELERYIYNIGYKISFNEIYKNYKYFKHSIYNTIEYSQTPYLNQQGIPDFIEDDRIEEEKRYTYTLTNYLTSKDWNLKQSFTQGYDAALEKNQWEPLETKINFNYKDLTHFYFENHYNYEKNETEYMENRLRINYKSFYAQTEFIFDKAVEEEEKNTTWQSSIGVDIQPFELAFVHESYKKMDEFSYNFKNFKTQEYTAKIIYNSDCWSLGFSYSEEEYEEIAKSGTNIDTEKTLFLIVKLKGLGGAQKEILSGK